MPRHRRGGGIPRLRLGTSYLITLHYSLKNLPLSTWVRSASCRIPQSKIKDFCQLPLAREPCGESPLTISHDGFLRIVLSLTRPVSLLRYRWMRSPKPPLPKGGASATPRRGDTQAPPGYFLPNHSSLFTKKPSPFHIGLYFGKVPPVESLSQKSKIFASSL